MKAELALALLALAAGFIAGFIWGGSTRDAVPGATTTSFDDGTLTVRVKASAALRQGLDAFLG